MNSEKEVFRSRRKQSKECVGSQRLSANEFQSIGPVIE